MGTLKGGKSLVLIGAGVIIACSYLLLKKSQDDQKRQIGLTHLRRLGIGFLLYAQDWDSCPTPLQHKEAQKTTTWVDYLAPYMAPDDINNPLNPLLPNSTEAGSNMAVRSGYALNYRFWDTFGKGGYPLTQLELPAQTALFVEAGAPCRDPLRPPTTPNERLQNATEIYRDTTDKIEGYCPYPSARTGKIGVVAADGHIVTVKVAYYEPNALHDTLLGRIGGNIYNWNGGFEGGKTDGKPRE
jgi:hypothetical protein